MAETETPLESILPADSGEAPAPETAAEPRSEAPATPTAPEPAEDKSWTYAALKDERAKRQAYEQRARELEARARDLEVQLQATREEPQQQATDGNDFWSNPESHLAGIERRANFRASKAEFVAAHGHDMLNLLDQAVEHAMRSNHPDIPILKERMMTSDDPVGVALKWVQQSGIIEQSQQQQPAARGPVYPSNLATARNVGSRSGPAWTGPTPLDDIFERGRR
jgi:hypothetical protein